MPTMGQEADFRLPCRGRFRSHPMAETRPDIIHPSPESRGGSPPMLTPAVEIKTAAM